MLNQKVLESYIDKKLIKRIKHPDYDIWIYNYTEYCNGMRLWDNITELCRSLIVDNNCNIIGRGFPKFFNYNEPEVVIDELKDTNYEIYEKLDGSLILLFYYNEEWIFTSKGCFDNNQIIKAKELFAKNSFYDLTKMDQNLTYVYEIIYPNNRIIVNYGKREELVYLTSFTKEGIEVNINKNLIIRKEHLNTCKELQKEESDLEGYIIRFESGYRVKVKFLKYLANHKIYSNLSNGKIKKLFITTTLDQMLIDYPEELHDFIKEEYGLIKTKYDIMYKKIREEYNDFHTNDRKLFFQNISKSKNKTILSYMYSDKLDLVKSTIINTY